MSVKKITNLIMIKTILAISGKPGLYKLVRQGKNMLIVESLTDKKRTPAYAHDKVISLGDVSMYTVEDDVPLSTVLESLKAKTEGKPVDIKSFKDDSEVRAFFKEVLPDFDEDRVYTADIKKLFSWYNQLIAAGITDFAEPEENAVEENEDKEKNV